MSRHCSQDGIAGDEDALYDIAMTTIAGIGVLDGTGPCVTVEQSQDYRRGCAGGSADGQGSRAQAHWASLATYGFTAWR